MIEQKLKLGALVLAMSLLAACASRPPAPAERVVPRPTAEEPTPARPTPPPIRPAEPVTTPAPDGLAAPVEIPGSPEQQAAPRAALPVLPPAAKSLVVKADQASAAGKHDEASSHLERALRIAPQHPVLWQNLAVVRYRQRDYDKVEGLALKSNALAADAPTLKRANWELIATVRRLKGNLRGADAATAEARRLEAEAKTQKSRW